MEVYQYEEYKDFEFSALARITVDDDDEAEDELEEALNRSQLEDFDPAFEELYNLSTPTEDDVPESEKGNKRGTLLQRFGHRSDEASSIASGRSRISNRSSKSNHTQKSFKLSPGIRRTHSHDASNAMSGGSKTPPSSSSSKRTLRGSLRNSLRLTPLRGKSSNALHGMAMRSPASLGKKPSRGIPRNRSISTKDTYPEDRSFLEARSTVDREVDNNSDSDSSIYFDDDFSSNDEAGELSEDSSVDFNEAVATVGGPPVFLVETSLKAAHESLNMHSSLPIMGVSVLEESEELEA